MSTWQRFIAVLVLIMFIGSGAFFAVGLAANHEQTNAVQQEALQRQYEGCVRGNEARRAIRDAFDVLIAAAQESPPNDGRTPEERQRLIDKFRGDLVKKLPAIDCKKP